METRQVLVKGLDLVLAEAGAGQVNKLLLLHGFASAKEDFTGWLDELAALGWHAVVYDQRGHGESAHPQDEAAYSLAILADDVLGVADELAWDRFVLLGHSMGGMAAQLFALGQPNRLHGLILMGTSHMAPDGIGPELVKLGQDVVRAGGTAALVQAQKELGPGPLETAAHRRMIATRPDYEAFSHRKTLAASDEMWVALAGEILTHPDRLRALAALTVPTLVIVGSHDEAFLAQSRAMAAAIPAAELAVIDDAGHSPQFETRQEWWAVVSRFLARMDQEPATLDPWLEAQGSKGAQ